MSFIHQPTLEESIEKLEVFFIERAIEDPNYRHIYRAKIEEAIRYCRGEVDDFKLIRDYVTIIYYWTTKSENKEYFKNLNLETDNMTHVMIKIGSLYNERYGKFVSRQTKIYDLLQ